MYEPFCISVLFLDIGIATFGGAGWWLLRKTWQVLAATEPVARVHFHTNWVPHTDDPRR